MNYKYGESQVKLATEEIDATLMMLYEEVPDEVEFEYELEVEGDKARFFLSNDVLGKFPLSSLTAESDLRVALGGLEKMFANLPFETAIDTVNMVMKRFTGNDPVEA